MKKTLDEVLAEAAIRDIQMRYCRGADRMDFDLMRSCFHADATIDFVGESDVDGFIEMGRKALPAYVMTTHNTGNQLVEVTGDTAWAEHYAVATHRLAADAKGPERDFVASMRYVDRLECREGEWGIVRRTLVMDWARTDPVGEPRYESKSHGGKRDRSDLSYLR